MSLYIVCLTLKCESHSDLTESRFSSHPRISLILQSVPLSSRNLGSASHVVSSMPLYLGYGSHSDPSLTLTLDGSSLSESIPTLNLANEVFASE